MGVGLPALCPEPPSVWVLRQKHSSAPSPVALDAASGQTPGCGSSVPCAQSCRPEHWLGLSSSTSNPGRVYTTEDFLLHVLLLQLMASCPGQRCRGQGGPQRGQRRGTLPTPCWSERQLAGSPGDPTLGWRVPFSAPRGLGP